MTIEEIEELEQKETMLQQELQKIREQELRLRKLRAREKFEYILEHKDVILPLLKHECASCDGEHWDNGYSHKRGNFRCKKCVLMQVIDGEINEYEFEFDIDLFVNQIKE